MTLGPLRAARHGLALALLGPALLATFSCREPPPAEQPLPEPVRDPTWRDPALQVAELPAAATTTLPDEGFPIRLAPAAPNADPPESVTEVMASAIVENLSALSLVAELPQPVTVVAAGMGNTESWVYIRPVRGSAYNIEMRVQHREIVSLAQLEAAAGEVGERPLLASGTSGGRWWVQKAVEGPVQEWWVALPALPKPTLPKPALPQPEPAKVRGAPRPTVPLEPQAAPKALVAVCVGPPAYEAVVRRACLTLQREGDPAPPPWDATLTSTP